ncbi:MAG: aminotransferase class I/II-fold pyridoxal phosphate-dependent enzyme [Actinobacteria bacterium]|nr:aminotransferase class I/II-fold pyridoxal phosphate-dependent enzyme [Actinomycetota bacterium]
MNVPDDAGFATRSIHSGESADPSTGAHTPIYQTATFAFASAEQKEAVVDAAMAWEPASFFYTRTGNPTTDALERKLASLEGAESAVVSASGMAAVANTLFSLLKAGDHCVASKDVFIITRFLLDDVLGRRGIDVTRVDVTDVDAVRSSLRENTKAVFIESLSNPHMDFADIPALAELLSSSGIPLIVDNTFVSPYLLRPLEHGADLVLHSATKYLSGHGDTVAGVVAGDKKRIDAIRYELDALGSAPSPFNSWLVLRGVRTLPLRMEAHSRNAQALAEYLDARDEVEAVHYIGLPSHPHHEVAMRLMGSRFGGMLSMKLHGGAEAMNTFVNAVRLGAIAVSLGDLRTLVYPMPKRDNLIRVSVGCEDIEDLIADFEQALSHPKVHAAV